MSSFFIVYFLFLLVVTFHYCIMYSKTHILLDQFDESYLNTAALSFCEGNLKDFLLFCEGNFGQKKEKIRKFPIFEMEALNGVNNL